MKKGPLSRMEKTYIVKNIDNGVIDISKKINRTEKCVIDFLNDVGMLYTMESQDTVAVKEEEKKIQDSLPQAPTVMSNIGIHKKGTGVVVMTEAAAMLSDEKRTSRNLIPDQFRMSNHKKDK